MSYKEKVLIAVTGSIAAYKIPSVISFLINQYGIEVMVMMTDSAKKFITELTLSTVSCNKVYGDGDWFSPEQRTSHIDIANWADVIAVAPATYNTINKLKNGIADNFVTTTIAAFDGKVLIFPAMNTKMLEKLEKLEKLENVDMGKYKIFDTSEGVLACGDIGKGKLLPTTTIVELILKNM